MAKYLRAGLLVALWGAASGSWTTQATLQRKTGFVTTRLSQDRIGAIVQGRSRGDLCMKSNKRREAEIDRLAKIEAESGKKKSKNGKKGPADESADAPTPGPLVSRHRVLLLKPSPKAPSQEGQPQDKVEGTAGWQTVLAEELTGSGGFGAERVREVEHACSKSYGEAKAMAYLKQGLRINNATFVTAAGEDAGDVLCFLEKHQARGAILIDPPALYMGRERDWESIRQNGVFYGVVSSGQHGEEEAEAVRDGLGIQQYLVRRVPGEPNAQDLAKAVNGLVKDWQFLESFSLQPIELFE